MTEIPSAKILAFKLRDGKNRSAPDPLRYPATLRVLASRADALLETLKTISCA